MLILNSIGVQLLAKGYGIKKVRKNRQDTLYNKVQ